MRKISLLIATAFALSAGAAAAGDGRDVLFPITIQGPHAKMSILAGAAAPTPMSANKDGKAQVTIFSSLASKYPKGVYWCCSGYNVMGSNSGVGVQWMGGAFTPAANHTLTRVEVAVGYSGQGPNGVVISVNEDEGGFPGKVLKKWNVSGLPVFGTCCTTVVKTDKTGIALTGGEQYWIVASTGSGEADTVDGWNVSDADQIDQATTASWDGTIWHVFQTAPGLAFAVEGSD